MKKSRKRLTLNERIVIETLLKENKSKNYIINKLNLNSRMTDRTTIKYETKI